MLVQLRCGAQFLQFGMPSACGRAGLRVQLRCRRGAQFIRFGMPPARAGGVRFCAVCQSLARRRAQPRVFIEC